MVICTIEVNENAPQTIVIGRRGTYNTQEVVFDIGYLISAYGAGTAVLAIKRSQDSSAYPTVVTQEDTTLTWTVSETDTYYKGAGECELMWYVNGGLAKTIIYPLVVMRDILSTAEEAPDAYQEWVDELTALGAETLQNAQDAAQSATEAENAKDDAVTAKEAAESAADRAETAADNSESSETNAATSASAATAKASEAATSATSASQSATSASGSATNASASASSASASASTATGKAAEAATSATNAAQSATSASASATSASGSASAASTSAGQAVSSASAAATSASQASSSASSAGTSATTASNAATTATTQAGIATTKAGEAAASATAASGSATAAGAAQTAAETAQAAAEAAAESVSASAAQIAQNTEDIGTLNNALKFATGAEAIEIAVPNKYLRIVNNVIDVDHPQTSATGYGYVVVPCSPGDMFVVNGVSSSNEPMAWAFTNSSYTILKKSASNITVTNAQIEAPENAAYLVIHDKAPYRLSYKGMALQDAIGDLSRLKTYSKSSLVDATNEVYDDLANANGIKYTFVAGHNTLVSGTYKADGTIEVNPKRLRIETPMLIEHDSYIVFIPGTVINGLLLAVKQPGQSTYDSGSWVENNRILKIASGSYVIPVYRNNGGAVVDANDYDANSYIVSEGELYNRQLLDYSRRLEYYAYKDGAKIATDAGTILDDSRFIVSAFIPVSPNEIFNWYYGTVNATTYTCFYDLNKSLLTAYSNAISPRVITADQNAAFMRVSLCKEDTARLTDIKGNTVFAVNAIGQLYNFDNSSDVIPDNDYEVMPENWTYEVGYRRSQQYTDLKWAPKHNVPRSLVNGGAEYFPANVERVGMLYSDTYGTNKVVGFDVSMRTFMTAVNNPYSLLYTENCNPNRSQSAYGITYIYGDADTAAYYGTACNHFVMMAIGSPISYSSYDVKNHSTDYGYPFEKVYDQTANGLQLLDILATNGHCLIVTRLWKTQRGVVSRVGVSEAGEDGATNSQIYTAAGFNNFITSAGYEIFRYTELYKNIEYVQSPFVAIENETIVPYVYNDDICTFAGDYPCFAEGDLLYINYTKGSYTQMEIYKNDVLLETVNLDNSADVHSVNLTEKNYTYGKYKARLKSGTTYSDFTYWEILNANISLSDNTLSISSANGTPLYWMWTANDGYTYKKVIITPEQILAGEIDVSDKSASYPQMKVVFQGDYGRIARIIA